MPERAFSRQDKGFYDSAIPGMRIERSRSLRVPMTDQELRQLHELSEAEGMTAADLVRQFVRRAHQARFGSKKTLGARR
jgi:hypothetical protein